MSTLPNGVLADEPWWSELVDLEACEDAVEWARTQPSLTQAWRRCTRGDWMLWYASLQDNVARKRLVWVACQCARLSLKHVPDGENRPRIAIETAEAWTRGDAILREVRAAAYAADDAAYAADAADAADAAYAAANAADAAYAAYAAYAAACAAANAAYAANAATETATLAECARIVRREWPTIAALRRDVT